MLKKKVFRRTRLKDMPKSDDVSLTTYRMVMYGDCAHFSTTMSRLYEMSITVLCVPITFG